MSKTEITASEQDNQLPAELMAEMEDHGDLGYSEKSDDSLIPIVAILQDNSGEVKKKHDRHIEGCEAGDLIIRSLKMIFKADLASDEEGNDGILFQPCGFQHMLVQWRGEAGEGQIITQYPFEECPEEAEEREDPENPGKMELAMPNGDRLVDTRYHYGNIIEANGELLPCVIPFGGTNHTVSRQWTSLMKRKKTPSGKKAPSFFNAYRLGSVFRQKGQQSWYSYTMKEEGPITDKDTLVSGFEMLKAIAEQKISVDTKSDTSGSENKKSEKSPID